jgi:hypothetical protein
MLSHASVPFPPLTMSLMSFPHAPPLKHVFCSLLLWQCGTPKFLDHYISSIVQPPWPTSPPLQSSCVVDVDPNDTWDPLVASPLPHTKLVAHGLTQKTYLANQNKTCPKPAQEDIADDAVSSTPTLYHDDHATHPMKDSLLDLTNSTLS